MKRLPRDGEASARVASPRVRARRLLSLVLACAALAGAASALSPAAALAAGTGSIKGVVTAAETKAAIAGIEACAQATTEPFAEQCASTNATGEYEIAALAAGTYDVRFAAPEESSLNYFTQFYKEKPTKGEVDPVTVTEGVATPEIDAALLSGGEVTGTVTDGEGKALAGIHVCALDPATGLVDRCVQSGAGGSYAVARLPSGSYELEFAGPLDAALGYATAFYAGAFSRNLATPVQVTAGPSPTEGINAIVQRSASIGGTVTSASTKDALAGVLVCASDSSIDVTHCAETSADGAYAVTGLAPGSYLVHFEAPKSGASYAPQFYKGASAEAAAETVPAPAGSAIAGIDAVLQGVPVALLKPAIVGRAIVGQTLSFIAGTWTNTPTGSSDEWGRCDGSVIETCHTIAATPTYTLTSADVGHTIRIREQVFNAYGIGVPEFLFSPPTAVVVAPAQAGAPPASAGPGSGVLSTTATAATNAQLKALLASLLTPRGKSAKIGALLKRRGYAVSFVSLIAGRLSIAWYLVPKGAHLAAAKPVLVAVGKASTPVSGSSKLTIKLTAKGRGLLAQGRQVKLTAKGVLAVPGRPSLSATRSFTLKR